jgi:hypothetical protein
LVTLGWRLVGAQDERLRAKPSQAHLLSLGIHYHHRINNFVSFGHAFAEQACFPSFGLMASVLDFDHCVRSTT